MREELLQHKEFIFRHDGSTYFCTNFRTALTPADIADCLGFSIPDKCVFLRCKDYDNDLTFEFRDTGSVCKIYLYSIKK